MWNDRQREDAYLATLWCGACGAPFQLSCCVTYDFQATALPPCPFRVGDRVRIREAEHSDAGTGRVVEGSRFETNTADARGGWRIYVYRDRSDRDAPEFIAPERLTLEAGQRAGAP